MTLKCPPVRDCAGRVYRTRRNCAGRAVWDHTGYYNEVDSFPVFTVTHIPSVKMRFIIPPIPGVRQMNRGTGCSTERSVRADSAKTVPEIVDFYLPPEGCSYRLAVVTSKNSMPDTRSAS